MCVHASVQTCNHIRRPGDHFWELILSFCRMSPVVLRLGGKGFIYSTHLTNS